MDICQQGRREKDFFASEAAYLSFNSDTDTILSKFIDYDILVKIQT